MTNNKWVFWILHLCLAYFFIQHGFEAFFSAHYLDEMRAFGFPLYFVPFHGMAKILGGLFLLIPRKFFLKHWAYSGMFFNLIFACIAEYNMGEIPVFQLFLTAILLVSYYFYLKFAPYKALD